MSHKHLLHELLKEDQEPFRLQSYIADRRSQLNHKPTPTTILQLKKPKPIIIHESPIKPTTLCKHACFFPFHNSSHSPISSPFPDFHSPSIMSPCPKSPVFLHIPSKTTSLLVEAAMRIHKHQSKPNRNPGFGLFGSFLKRLKDRSKSKKRSLGDAPAAVRRSRKNGKKKREDKEEEGTVRISCSSQERRRMSSADWTEVKTSEASTSGCGSDYSEETRFCLSPFRFSLRQSPSSSAGRRTPDFCSPAASPRYHDKEKYDTRNSDKVRGGGEEEEKEQCSPVSVLEPPFEDDGHASEDADEDDYDLECSYANVQRAKQQLLYRLRRFEKLAELDPMELERKLLEGSDCEDHEERELSEDEEPFSSHMKHGVDIFVTEVFNQSNLQIHSKKMSTDMKRLVSDLIVEEKGEITCSKDVVLGRICNRLDSWREVEFDTIDMMIELDFKKEFDGWKNFTEQVEETAADIEFAIFGLLMEELSEDLYCMDECHQEINHVDIECT